MSDFDDVLERLLSDPGFKARLAADPASALAGYRLSAEELEVLRVQVGADPGGESRVEQRTSKAGMFGLFSEMGSIGSGIGDAVAGSHGHGHGIGDAVGAVGGRHAAPSFDDAGSGAGFGRHLGAVGEAAGGFDVRAGSGGFAEAGPGGAYASSGDGYAAAGPGYAAGYGSDPGYGAAGLAEAGYGQPEAGYGQADASYGNAGLAEAPGAERGPSYYGGNAGGDYGNAGLAEAGHGQVDEPHGFAGLAEAPSGVPTEVERDGQGTVYRASTYGSSTPPAPPSHGGGLAGLVGDQGWSGQPSSLGERHGLGAPTDGYHTRVDWDGDGRWDQHTYVNRSDGGVNIIVDADGDGRPEFVGHDVNRDGLIDSSEVDTNHDGRMDARYEDVNGDGWLDRRTR
ncbi:hypothetical protein ACFFX1_47045 [Dactylosporangium sucinum]|uniref:EF-hand domain-containing protein n=1 Tax=Dactylosporangium sucinum TaxID=1424081 RepID=A0A917UD28_9ACTN|nr:hypothetical protein [Dactylosporangium sucinum]GGM75969.1 hypothetical protein GCM10007977_091800 [Dactylosporangium sucinum]